MWQNRIWALRLRAKYPTTLNNQEPTATHHTNEQAKHWRSNEVKETASSFFTNREKLTKKQQKKAPFRRRIGLEKASAKNPEK